MESEGVPFAEAVEAAKKTPKVRGYEAVSRGVGQAEETGDVEEIERLRGIAQRGEKTAEEIRLEFLDLWPRDQEAAWRLVEEAYGTRREAIDELFPVPGDFHRQVRAAVVEARRTIPDDIKERIPETAAAVAEDLITLPEAMRRLIEEMRTKHGDEMTIEKTKAIRAELDREVRKRTRTKHGTKVPTR